jgi:hypothetical protein
MTNNINDIKFKNVIELGTTMYTHIFLNFN